MGWPIQKWEMEGLQKCVICGFSAFYLLISRTVKYSMVQSLHFGSGQKQLDLLEFQYMLDFLQILVTLFSHRRCLANQSLRITLVGPRVRTNP